MARLSSTDARLLNEEIPAETLASVAEQLWPLVDLWLRAEVSAARQVSPVQLRALTILRRHDSLNLTQLAQELRTLPSWASRVCDRLEASGYLERRPRPENQREVVLTLRQDGRRLLEALDHEREELLRQALVQMTAPDRAALLRGLRGLGRATATSMQAKAQDEVS